MFYRNLLLFPISFILLLSFQLFFRKRFALDVSTSSKHSLQFKFTATESTAVARITTTVKIFCSVSVPYGKHRDLLTTTKSRFHPITDSRKISRSRPGISLTSWQVRRGPVLITTS